MRSAATVLHGDMRAVLAGKPADHFHACVTDPPYELAFMGKAWDQRGVSFDPATWAEVLRVLRPGGMLLAAGGSRTYHRMTCAIEDAGFEVRDCITHHYSTGFPKSYDLGKGVEALVTTGSASCNGFRDLTRGEERPGGLGYTALQAEQGCRPAEYETTGAFDLDPQTEEGKRWQGFGSALKPATEFWVLARKPLSERNLAANVLRWECGGINVDGCRVEGEFVSNGGPTGFRPDRGWNNHHMRQMPPRHCSGRWPTNLVLSHTPACDENACHPACPVGEIGRQGGESNGSGMARAARPGRQPFRPEDGWNGHSMTRDGATAPEDYGDSGDASRFFPVFWPDAPEFPFRYVPKPCRAERDAGITSGKRTRSRVNPGGLEHDPKWAPVEARNHHSTVKPVELMRWLVRLCCVPGGHLLDPFSGSGTTGMACALEGFDFTGIDQDEEYCELARQRIEWARTAFKSRPRGKKAQEQPCLEI